MRDRRAYVYFHDGFRFSPRINTHGDNLEDTIMVAIGTARSQLPEQVAAQFVAIRVLNEEFCVIENAPPGRTFGDYFANALAEGNWPTRDFDGKSYTFKGDNLPAGVFLVNTVSLEVTMIGGFGFREEDVNYRQDRVVELAPDDQEGEET